MMGPFAILLVFWWITLNPTITKDEWIASIASGQQLGNDEKIERSIRNAASSDTWSPEAVIWLADFYRWKLIQQMDRQDIDSIDDLHRLWTQAIQEVRNRVGQDAGVDRVIGIQAIHLYQRWGEQRDLEIAHFAFQRALERSPTDQWLLAQLSVIERAMGNTKEAQALAIKAIEFSQLGNNIERSIDRQIIYVAKILGIQASETPIRTAATTLIN
jgi:tetratricopeptide (TPR) repeat protein